MIKSKFGFYYVYFSCFILILFLAGAIYLVTHDIPIRTKFGATWSSIYPGLFILCILSPLGYFFVKRITRFSIWPDRLEIYRLFSQETIQRSDIDSIDLTARENLGYWSNQRPTNVTIVTARDGRKWVFEDNYYRNAPE